MKIISTWLPSLIVATTSFALSACAVNEDPEPPLCLDGKCDDNANTCTDERYGDGVCDQDLACAAPDIDCFVTFDTDVQAAAWYEQVEAEIAAETGASPRALVPPTDPRHIQTRELLDRGWDAFRANRPVGDLRLKRPGLVLIDDPEIQAFVAPDLDFKRASLVVIVHTGALSNPDVSRDGMLGLMMHELQHVVGLHVLPGAKESGYRFYVAPEGVEPIGRLQVEDLRVRKVGLAWMAAAGEVGPHSDIDLGSLPFEGGRLQRVLLTVMQSNPAANTAACTSTREMLARISPANGLQIDPFSGVATVAEALRPIIEAALDELETKCLAGFTTDYAAVVAKMTGKTPDQVLAGLTPDDRARVTGVHVVAAIRALTEDRRAIMRASESSFVASTGRPWSALRYFSTEEDADDVSVPVLRGAGLAATGLNDFLVTLLEGNVERCFEVLSAGEVPPYGADLTDDHHGVCWRLHHVSAVAKSTDRALARPAKKQRVDVAQAPLLPPRLVDLITH